MRNFVVHSNESACRKVDVLGWKNSYRVETMDMIISHWKNGVSGKVLISIVVSTMVLIVRDKILS